MKKYLYVYSDSSINETNQKEIIHNSDNLKKSTIYREAEGRKFLSIYSIIWDDFKMAYIKDKFIKSIAIN